MAELQWMEARAAKRTSLDTQIRKVLQELEIRINFRSVSLLFCHLSSTPTLLVTVSLLLFTPHLHRDFFLRCFLSQNMFSNKVVYHQETSHHTVSRKDTKEPTQEMGHYMEYDQHTFTTKIKSGVMAEHRDTESCLADPWVSPSLLIIHHLSLCGFPLAVARPPSFLSLLQPDLAGLSSHKSTASPNQGRYRYPVGGR